MNQNNIEDILEQYSEDKRQQQQLSAHLRHLARRQARIRVGIVGTIAALFCVVAVAKILSPSRQAAPMLTSSHTTPTTTDSINHPSTDSVVQQPKNDIHHSPRHHIAQTDITNNQAEPTLLADISQPIANLEFDTIADNTTTPISDTTAEPRPFPAADILAEHIITTGFEDNTTNVILTPTTHDSRIKLISSLSASAIPSVGMSYANDVNNFISESADPIGETFTTLDPKFSLSADIGAAYTITSSPTSRLDIGLSLSGYTQQGIANKYIANSNGPSFVTDGDATSLQHTDNYTYNAFCLFANFPIQLELFPLGSDKTGWSLSLTPAHSIARTHPLGAGNKSPYEINPWKLTVGLGIVIPHRIIRHIGFTTNLLPIYTSKSVREIGIRIGF